MNTSPSNTKRTAASSADNAATTTSGKLREAANDTSQSANDTARSGQEGVSSIGEKIGDAYETARDQASEAAGTARKAVESGVREAANVAGEAYDRTSRTVEDTYRMARDNATYAARELDAQTRNMRDGVSRFAVEHPVMLAVMGFAGGLVLGALLPKSSSRGNSDTRHTSDDQRYGRSSSGWNNLDEGMPRGYGGNDMERRSEQHGHGGGSGRVTQ